MSHTQTHTHTHRNEVGQGRPRDSPSQAVCRGTLYCCLSLSVAPRGPVSSVVQWVQPADAGRSHCLLRQDVMKRSVHAGLWLRHVWLLASVLQPGEGSCLSVVEGTASLCLPFTLSGPAAPHLLHLRLCEAVWQSRTGLPAGNFRVSAPSWLLSPTQSLGWRRQQTKSMRSWGQRGLWCGTRLQPGPPELLQSEVGGEGVVPVLVVG